MTTTLSKIQQCFSLERLDRNQIRQIDPSLTVREMVEQLDAENIRTSKIGVIVKRDIYHRFTYNEKGDGPGETVTVA